MLVIFDCDGVLVDSEPIANRVFAKLISEHGWEISLEEATRRFLGRSLPSCIVEIEEKVGKPLPPTFAAEYYSRTYASFQTELQAVPGVREAIVDLSCPFCVASSSSHEKIRLSLGVVGLLELFEGRIFSSEDVRRGKPAPDLFFHAAAKMGFSSGDCVVIEDSVAGVQAGIAAGMRVLAYQGSADPSYLASLGATPFDHMDQLAGLLR